MMNDVYKLIDKGFKPNGSESLESFVEKYREHIDEGAV